MVTLYEATVGKINALLEKLYGDADGPPIDPNWASDYWKQPNKPVWIKDWGYRDLDPGDPEVGPQPDIVFGLNPVGMAAEAEVDFLRGQGFPGSDAEAAAIELPPPTYITKGHKAVVLQWVHEDGSWTTFRMPRTLKELPPKFFVPDETRTLGRDPETRDRRIVRPDRPSVFDRRDARRAEREAVTNNGV